MSCLATIYVDIWTRMLCVVLDTGQKSFGKESLSHWCKVPIEQKKIFQKVSLVYIQVQ